VTVTFKVTVTLFIFFPNAKFIELRYDAGT